MCHKIMFVKLKKTFYIHKILTTILTTIFLTNTIIGRICCTEISENIKVFTVATENNDGYNRYIRSAKYYGIEVNTLGMGLSWKGGYMAKYTGGGQKINLLRDALDKYKNEQNTIIIFTDSYDVVFNSNLDEIIHKFKQSGSKILFSAERYCWPDKNVKDLYPEVPAQASRYLNSGMFIGYASDVFDLIKSPIKDDDDDQLYYTQKFLNESLRKELGIQLDYKSEIFQNLNGAINDVKLNIDPETTRGVLQNLIFMTTPNIIHGNGFSKIYLNSFANYLGGTFENNECIICKQNLANYTEKTLPIITMVIHSKIAVPFFEEFLNGIYSIDYPKEKLHLYFYNDLPYLDDLVKSYTSNYGSEYNSSKLVLSTDNLNEIEARKLSIQQAIQKGSEFIFFITSDAHIDDSSILLDLIKFNKSFIAPVLTRPNELFSNFWGAISNTGFYARSYDYVDIVKGNIKGMWNVPYVSNCYLIKKSAYKKMNFEHESLDSDMALCDSLRNAGVFMNVINTKIYGHLVNADNFNSKLTKPDFYTLFTNPYDWEKRYIHPQYYDQLESNYPHKQPCPDVYWFPIVTEKFCEDLITIMETYGKWSDGTNSDKRLEGGYEAVPTRDIHMKQVGLDAMWLKFLQLYVRPLVETVFIGYYQSTPRSLMNFVVRYRPDEQPFLRPHHDSSTYTINIALNRVGIDYEGGGCRFLRYNCSVTATKRGWMLMHPGRLTHFHEGLRVTNGTRYIMISFVDP